MRVSHKLLLVLILSVVATLGLVAAQLLTRFEADFIGYLNLVDQRQVAPLLTALSHEHAREGSFDHLASGRRVFRRFIYQALVPDLGADRADRAHPPWRQWRERRHDYDPTAAPPYSASQSGADGRHPNRGPAQRSSRTPSPLPPGIQDLASRLSLFNADRQHIVGAYRNLSVMSVLAIHENAAHVASPVIGWLGMAPRDQLANDLEQAFARTQAIRLLYAALILIAAAIPVALVLSRHWTRPLRLLAGVAQRLAKQRQPDAATATAQLDTRRQDEFGDLARDFVKMATTLEQHERTRHQWLVDISHELRTPLSVLRGEIEALQDGVRTPDESALASLGSEVETLTRLVDDLHQLSMSDAGNFDLALAQHDPGDIISAAFDIFSSRFESRGIELQMHVPDYLPTVYVDAVRIRQVLENLLENALRYTDPGGRVKLEAAYKNDSLIVRLEDSAPGVRAVDLPHLFDRLYRVDASRSRKNGGSGLGLSICKSIVETHGGGITATNSALGGLQITVTLPIVSTPLDIDSHLDQAGAHGNPSP